MKSTVKILKWSILPIIILLVILGVAFYLFGELILKTGIETAATKALAVGVSIDDVDLSVIKGRVGIKNIVVSNPAGYTHKNLLILNDGQVTASIGSLLSDTVHIKQIKLDGLQLTIEQKALSNNLQDVIKSLPAKDKPESAPAEAGKKLHIDELEITNINVKAKLLPIPGKADTISLNLAPIRMSNLGTDNKLSTAILVNKILLAIAEGIARQGAGVLPENMVGKMKSTLDETIKLGKTATKESEKLIDTGKDIVEGFKGLLKPKKKE